MEWKGTDCGTSAFTGTALLPELVNDAEPDVVETCRRIMSSSGPCNQYSLVWDRRCLEAVRELNKLRISCAQRSILADKCYKATTFSWCPELCSQLSSYVCVKLLEDAEFKRT